MKISVCIDDKSIFINCLKPTNKKEEIIYKMTILIDTLKREISVFKIFRFFLKKRRK